LKIVEPGLQTTLQDLGRVGHQKLGIPVSGALDWVSLRLANALIGNPQGMAALEISYLGPTIEVAAESVRIALFGTIAPLEVLSPEPLRIPAQRSVRLVRGQRFKIGGIGDSAVAYVAVEGGFALPPLLGSLSTHWRAGLGGLEGRKLIAGDVLPLAQDAAPERDEAELTETPLMRPARFRVVLGPQDELFSREQVALLLGSTYQVSREADRWGMRLDGPPLTHTISIVSDAIPPGAIQVPGGGQPIVLMADRSTTGGYPKIGAVISADLPALGRLLPGAAVAFTAVGVAEAEAVRRSLEQRIAALVASVGPVAAVTAIDVARLHTENLIGGVVDAAADSCSPPAE
jgi:biotin-dependent carboxylase-like uncharacterized protein